MIAAAIAISSCHLIAALAMALAIRPRDRDTFFVPRRNPLGLMQCYSHLLPTVVGSVAIALLLMLQLPCSPRQCRYANCLTLRANAIANGSYCYGP